MAIFEDVNSLVKDLDLPDAVTRKHVGLKKTAPFIKGYWYLYIDLPKAMKDTLKYEVETFRKLFSGMSINFTPPSDSINFADDQHLGGTSKHYSGYTKNNDFSITYKELSGSPIWKFHEAWKNLLADHATGLANIDVVPENYKTTFLVIQTTPVGARAVDNNFKFDKKHIEKVFLLIGVAPPSDPQTGSFDSDISSPGNLTLSYSYTCDDWYTEMHIPELKELAAKILNEKIFTWTKFTNIAELFKDGSMSGSIFG